MSFNVKVKCAQHDRSTFNLRMPHLTSAEFMENNVILSKCVVPTDKFEIEPVFEARCAALSEPSFINTEYHIRGFYVPHSLVWERFDDWINGNTTFINGAHILNDPPTVNDAFLTRFLIYQGVHAPDTSVFDASTWDSSSLLITSYDFAVPDPSTNGYKAYKFNNRGRYWYKLLTSLGYKMNFTLDASVGDDMNAFPLLSYMRVWVDYFVPSLRKQTSAVNQLLSIFYNSALDSNRFDDVFPGSEIDKFAAAMRELYHCYYPSSYLTSSWQSPVQPLNLNSNTSTLVNLNQYKDAFNPLINYKVNASGNSGDIGSSMADGSFTLGTGSTSNPWVQRNIQKVVDWLTRSRFIGMEKVLNILARFGVKPDNPLAHTARLVGSFTQPLLVQDVNAMSDTYDVATRQGSKLGEYAGKMFTMARDSKKFTFNCDDYGCIIITSMICPADIMYYQGIDREMLRIKPTQYYQPEFDSVGCEVLSMRELMSGFNFPKWETILNGQTGAGFVPRYSSYKVANATVSGDFIVPTLNDAHKFDAYHHFRALYKYGKYRANAGSPVTENSIVPNTGIGNDIQETCLSVDNTQVKSQMPLLQTAYDKSQFNRIFNVESDTVDHIYTMYYFNINASRPMLSISDSLPLTDMEGSDKKIDTASPVIENNR